MSPCHLSQPETPVLSEFGDELLPTLRDLESFAHMGRCNSSDLDLPLARPSYKAGQQEGDTQTSHATLGSFQGYSLSDHDRSSVLTARKLPSPTPKKIDGASPLTQQKTKQDLVHSWNDGSEHHMTALGELVDDLGYLGTLII